MYETERPDGTGGNAKRKIKDERIKDRINKHKKI